MILNIEIVALFLQKAPAVVLSYVCIFWWPTLLEIDELEWKKHMGWELHFLMLQTIAF